MKEEEFSKTELSSSLDSKYKIYLRIESCIADFKSFSKEAEKKYYGFQTPGKRQNKVHDSNKVL